MNPQGLWWSRWSHQTQIVIVVVAGYKWSCTEDLLLEPKSFGLKGSEKFTLSQKPPAEGSLQLQWWPSFSESITHHCCSVILLSAVRVFVQDITTTEEVHTECRVHPGVSPTDDLLLGDGTHLLMMPDAMMWCEALLWIAAILYVQDIISKRFGLLKAHIALCLCCWHSTAHFLSPPLLMWYVQLKRVHSSSSGGF